MAAIGSDAVTQDILLWTAVAALVACALLVLVILQRDRRRLRSELDARQADLEALRHRVDGLTARVPRQVDDTEYVITDLGLPDPGFETGAERPPQPTMQRIDGKLFADLVLRETVVKAASLTHGVRRALSPEVVWRVRGEVRRELKRVRKQRKADLKVARLEWEARQREGIGDVA
jgi:hypothetical protein